MKIRNRIVFNFMVVTAVTLLLVSIFVYVFSLHHTHKFFYTRLRVRASIALQVYSEQSKSDLIKEFRERHLQPLPDEREMIVRYDSISNRWKNEVLPSNSTVFYEEAIASGFSEFQSDFVHYVGVYDKSKPDIISVAIAFDEEGKDQMASLSTLLLVGFLLSCVFVLALGRLLASQIIKPVSDIITEVTRINASSLDKRLTAATGGDEIATLAQTFNSMLDRLHTAFQLQNNFISNASHELRTPLTTLLGESDFILSDERTNDEYKRSIETIRQEAEKLNELVTSLLDLSQVGFDGKRQILEPMNIDLMLMKIKAQINKRYPVNYLQIEVQDAPDNPDALALMCIPSWIELAFMNIITNAIKYSDNKDVKVVLTANETDLTIRIEDVGIGISETDMGHVFELFFRGSNSQSYMGHGIGLPLADKIIRLHGGTIEIFSKPQNGTVVTVNFKKSPETRYAF